MSDNNTIYDLVGLGFGPANISVAGYCVEKFGGRLGKFLFLEKQTEFGWQGPMLIPGSSMQISCLKDLALLRDPTSPLTFLNYLHVHDRLVAFINRGSTIPSRIEYADYLSWSAKYIQNAGVTVKYSSEVISLEEAEGLIEVTSKNVSTGHLQVYKARNIVVSPGGSARIPSILSDLFVPSHPLRPLVTHSSAYLTSVERLLSTASSGSPRPLRIAVIGSGQSAAEVSMNLLERLKEIPGGGADHAVEMIIRKGSLKPSDDSPFANEIFDPERTDAWFNASSDLSRAMQKQEYNNTNYGVVNPKTLEHMYEIIYNQKIQVAMYARNGKTPAMTPKLSIRPYSNILSATAPPDDVELSDSSRTFALIIQDLMTRKLCTESYDAIVCATGYTRDSWINLLKSSSTLRERYGVDKDLPTSAYSMTPGPVPDGEDLLRKTQQLMTREVDWNVGDSSDDSVSSGSGAEDSGISTPPTSAAQSTLLGPAQRKLYISRNYKLLPIAAEAKDGPRIYVQGVEEATHGLSDSLLSVVSVRSGEVVLDLSTAWS